MRLQILNIAVEIIPCKILTFTPGSRIPPMVDEHVATTVHSALGNEYHPSCARAEGRVTVCGGHLGFCAPGHHVRTAVAPWLRGTTLRGATWRSLYHTLGNQRERRRHTWTPAAALATLFAHICGNAGAIDDAEQMIG